MPFSTFMGLLAVAGLSLASPLIPRMLELDVGQFSQEKFDFVIVGGGTAGLITASRLAENRRINVGVIEAGKYRPNDPRIDIPQGAGYLGNPDYDWMYSTIPQPGTNNRSIFLARGKMVGGSSGINAMIWHRGAAEDYDSWSESIGNDPTWSWKGLLPYFKKAENWTPPTLKLFPDQVVTNDLVDHHGEGGPINLSYANYMTGIDQPCAATANLLGLWATSNPDAGNNTGFPLLARNVDPTNGQRCYTAPGYFAPDLSTSNLKLLTNAEATTINFQKSGNKITATGVNFLVGGKKYTVKASKEVILSAGSLKSPQLLELSGIGNAKLLKSLGIQTLVDLPSVGENLQDHPLCISDFKTRSGVETLDPLRFNNTYFDAAQAQYNASKTGPLTYTPSIYGLVPLQSIVNATRISGMLQRLDSQIKSRDSAINPLQKAQYKHMRASVAGGKSATVGFTVVPAYVGDIAALAPAEKGASYVSVVAISMHPFSRGSVHITSTNATAMPAINVNFLDFDFDTDLITEGLKFNRKWTETAPFSQVVESPHMPAANVTSDADVRQYLRNNMRPHNHALGTTVMAPKKLGGVVDSRLKVYGISNVRVIDAGIIPMMPSAAIAPTVYAVAEKASDLVKAEWHLF